MKQKQGQNGDVYIKLIRGLNLDFKGYLMDYKAKKYKRTPMCHGSY